MKKMQPVRIVLEVDYEIPFYARDCHDKYGTLNPREIVDQIIGDSGWGDLLEGRELRIVDVEYVD